MGKIDRAKVRKAFDRGACRYEETVIVQKLVIESILSEISKLNPTISPRRILDVGAGTGMLLRSLQKSYPEAFLAGLDLAPGMGIEAINAFQAEGNHLYVQGDAENLPFADGAFDLVVSTSTFQWLSVLDQAFSEASRVLAPGGIFLFALFGEGTLSELKCSYRRALGAADAVGKDRTHHLFSQGEVLHALAQSGFADVVTKNILEKEYYPDVAAFLRSLKGIGAGTTASMPSKGLAGRRIITKMMEFYQADYLDERGVPASYEVIYGRGRKV